MADAFGNMFGDESEDEFENVPRGTVNVKSRLRHMADTLSLPPIPRDPGIFAGLINQGATCYLNSLFQAFFFCPELREFFFKLDLDQMDAYEKGTNKYNIIHQFQLFFSKLKYLDFKNQSTMDLTSAFGWGGGEGSQQQDVAEAMRVIFDKLEICFFPSGRQEDFTKTFKGETINYITCLTCGTTKERSEHFYDLLLPIKNFNGANNKSIDESIQFLMNPEMLDGGNQYQCETCATKVDAMKGQRFGRLPEVLTMSLCRFDLNYQTWQRIKINDEYKFDLRLNFKKYTGGEEDQNYDLFAVIIHRGDAYGGHYHAIIRDTLEECKGLKDFFSHLEEEDQKEIMAEKQGRKWLEDAKDLPEVFGDILREEFILTEISKEEKEKEEKEKKEKEEKEKKEKEEEKKKKKKNKKDKKNKNEDKGDDPFPTEVERTPENEYLFNNWYDFDDTRVKKFDVNKLHKYFSGRECAYILMYRKTEKREMNEYYKNQVPTAGVYQEVLNLNEKLKSEKIYYEKMKFKLQFHIGLVDDIFDFDTLDTKKEIDPKKIHTFVVSMYDYVKDFKKLVQEKFGQEDDKFILVLYERAENETLDLTQVIAGYGSCDKWMQIQDLKTYHNTSWFLMRYDDERIHRLNDKFTIKNSRVRIKVEVEKETYELMVPKFMSDQELIEKLQPLVSWPLTLLDISVIDFGEFRPLVELPLITRSMGVPNDDFKFILKQRTIENMNEKIMFVTDGIDNYIEEGDFKSIIVTREENKIPSKIIVDYGKLTIEELLTVLKDKFGIPLSQARRLRDLQDNRLFTREDMPKTLIELGYVEGSQRIRFENGKIPLKGGHNVKVKYDLWHENGEKTTLTEDFIVYLNQTLEYYMPVICSRFNVDENEHNMYKCNWQDEAVKKIKHLKGTIEELGIEPNEVLRLMHSSLGLSQEVRSYDIYYSESGFPDEDRLVGEVKINENKGVKNLIQAIYEMVKARENDFENEFGTEHMLVREMNKRKRPGKVINGLKKSVRKNKINCINLIFTIYKEPVQVRNSQLRLFIRERSTVDYIYGDYDEIIIDTAEKKSMGDLREKIKFQKKIPEEKKLVLIKYNQKKYMWLRMQEDSDNLKRKPYFLRDGDIIGYLIHDEGKEPEDDFQTKEDKAFKAALEVKFDVDGAMFHTKHNDDHIGFSMNIDMDN